MSADLLPDDDDGEMFPVKSSHDEAHFDITAMIDLVFMMNIYFMVTALVTAMAEIDLAQAAHCTPADKDGAVIISIMADPGGTRTGHHQGRTERRAQRRLGTDADRQRRRRHSALSGRA